MKSIFFKLTSILFSIGMLITGIPTTFQVHAIENSVTEIMHQNLVVNGHFNDGLNAWESDGKTVIASNNPYQNGAGKHYSMDGGSAAYIKQDIRLPEDGNYTLSHWMTSTASTNVMRLSIQGKDIETSATPNGIYQKVSLNFEGIQGETVTVYIGQGVQPGSYTNGDAIYLGTSAEGVEIPIEKLNANQKGNLLSNHDFSDNLQGWTVDAVKIASNNPPRYQGIGNDRNHYASASGTSSLSRFIEIPQDGIYEFSQWVASSGKGGRMGYRQLDGSKHDELAIKNTGKYHYEALEIDAKKGERYELFIKPLKGWTNGDFVQFGLKDALYPNRSFEGNETRVPQENIATTKAFSGNQHLRVHDGLFLDIPIKQMQTGYYDLSTFVYIAQGEAVVEVLDASNHLVARQQLKADKNYQQVVFEDVALSQGGNSLRLKPTGGEAFLDLIDLNFKAEADNFLDINAFKTDGRIFKQHIDKYTSTISIEYAYGEDLSARTLQEFQVSQGVQAPIQVGSVLDLSQDTVITLRDAQGNSKDWTIRAKEYHRNVSLESSNKQIEGFFNWAVSILDKFVVTGQHGKVDDGKKPDTDYMPSYWAGYFNRTAFYSRDFVHQAPGAQIAGLTEENYHMFEAFAKGSIESRKWYAPWAYNFDGSIYHVDYKNDDTFVRIIPAQFELVEKAYEMYLWSGDRRYIENEAFLNFFEKSVTDFVELHDTQNPNGIAEGVGGLFKGLATYNERHNDFMIPGDPTIEAADGIATQYAAFDVYSKILAELGDTEGSEKWKTKAQELKRYFNEEWSIYKADPTNTDFVVELTKNGRQRTGFAMETNYFIPLKELVEPGPRNDAALEMILEGLGTGIGHPGAPKNIESYTYIPEMLYKYHKNEDAWHWMQYLDSIKFDAHEMAHQGTNGDYPEVSFTAISNTVEGMMGVEPDAPNRKITTISRLPKDIADIKVHNMEIGGMRLSLEHKGLTHSELENKSDQSMTWEVQFEGQHNDVFINGQHHNLNHKQVRGVDVSYIELELEANQTLHASIDAFDFIPLNPSTKTEDMTALNPSTKTEDMTPLNPSTKTEDMTPLNPSRKTEDMTPLNPSRKTEDMTPLNPSTKTEDMTPLNPSQDAVKNNDDLKQEDQKLPQTGTRSLVFVGATLMLLGALLVLKKKKV